MTGDLEVSREDYDPTHRPEHRDAPVTVPELVAPTLPGRDGAQAVEASVAPVPSRPSVEPVVEGRLADRPHFLRNVDGEEFCGQDGEPWPCREYQRTVGQVAQVTASPELVDVETAANAAGVPLPEFRARLEALGRRYR